MRIPVWEPERFICAAVDEGLQENGRNIKGKDCREKENKGYWGL